MRQIARFCQKYSKFYFKNKIVEIYLQGQKSLFTIKKLLFQHMLANYLMVIYWHVNYFTAL